MCGLLGTVNLPIDGQALELIRHRGPDGEGIAELQCGSHRVTFAHRRLAILDLSEHGAQPMGTSDKSHHIIFNGEIYNHQLIRDDLTGCVFHGHSDTETLLHALRLMGLDCLARLNGIFAFAYLDSSRKKLFLVRDPFGIKPLYYVATAGQLCFGSEMAPLYGATSSSIDKVAVQSLLKLRFVPSPRTLHSEIRRLRPGHVLEVDLGKDELFWCEYPFVGKMHCSGPRRLGFEAALREYGRLFEQAASRQLLADVEVGVLLSGGIDSALVAASAQKASTQSLKAFTVGFNEADAADVDEVNAAAETAELLEMDHYATRLGFDDFLDVLRDCVHIVEEPLATTSIIPMHFLAKLAASHVKVVLSGQGADELLGGYKRYQVELWRRFVPAFGARGGYRIANRLGIRNDTLLRGLKALREAEDVPRFLAAYEVFSDEDIFSLTGLNPGRASHEIKYFYDLLQCETLPSSAERMMAIDTRLGLADDLLLYTDKITMRESLECRVPFLDMDLASFVQSLPRKYRLKIGSSKIIHRAYAERTLPPSIINRPKRGFLSPTRHWFKNEEILRSLFLDKNSQFAEIFNLSAVERIIQEHQSGFNRERQIFLLLCISFCLNTLPMGRHSHPMESATS